MNIKTALKNRRSIRKYAPKPVSHDTLVKIVEMGKDYMCPANLQPLRFHIVQSDRTKIVYAHTKWAGYLPSYVLEANERPTAYIVILGDRTVSEKFEFSAGAAATQLALAAMSFGLASCCLGISDADALCRDLHLDCERYALICVLALGYPAQRSETEPMKRDCRYRIDGQGNFIVPKRETEELLICARDENRDESP